MKSAVKIILVNKQKQILLQLRGKNQPNAGLWSLFGGHIDGDESPKDALLREIKEELNYDLQKYTFIKETMVPDFGKVFWYRGEIDVPIEKLTLNEGDACKFFSFAEIKKLKISEQSKKILLEYIKQNK